MMAKMQVKIRIHKSLRCSSRLQGQGGILTLELSEGTTVEEVLKLLDMINEKIWILINGRYAHTDQILNEGDMVDFIPPITGG